MPVKQPWGPSGPLGMPRPECYLCTSKPIRHWRAGARRRYRMTVATTGQKTILVIEDDPWTRTITTALLAGEGFAVVEAKNGEEGLKRAVSMLRKLSSWIWPCRPRLASEDSGDSSRP